MKVELEFDKEKFNQTLFVLSQIPGFVGESLWAFSADEWVGSIQGIIAYMKSITPRSKKGDVHIADFYEREKVEEMGVVRQILIKNTHPRGLEILNYLDGGTSPHIIEGNPVLHFEMDGEQIWARVVRHPGTKPLFVIRKGERYIDTLASLIEERAREILDDVLARNG